MPQREPTAELVQAWRVQVDYLASAAAIAEQWSHPELAQDLLGLAASIRHRIDEAR